MEPRALIERLHCVKFSRLFTVVVVAWALAGCGSDDAETPCTTTGAAWGADVKVAEQPSRVVQRLEVELCQADRCQPLASVRPVEASNDLFFPNINPETVDGPLTVVATLFDRDGAQLATSSAPTQFETRYPNGENCGSQTVLESVALAL